MSRSAFALLACAALVPGMLGAQSATGTSSAGIYFEASGAGDPVVLIHGFSLDRRMWAPQIAALEGRYRVIRYDLRGHGKSDRPDAPYSPYEDLRSVLDALAVDRATLVGLSAGAELATDFALAYPDRVTRLVLAAPGLGGYKPSAPLTWMGPVFQAAAAGDPQRAAKLWAETPIMTLRNDRSAASTVAGIAADNARLWSYKSNPARPLTPPAITRLAAIKAPTLVIVGEQDLPHIKDIAAILASGIPGATLVTIPGAGHIVNFDASAAFNDALDRFLARR